MAWICRQQRPKSAMFLARLRGCQKLQHACWNANVKVTAMPFCTHSQQQWK